MESKYAMIAGLHSKKLADDVIGTMDVLDALQGQCCCHHATMDDLQRGAGALCNNGIHQASCHGGYAIHKLYSEVVIIFEHQTKRKPGIHAVAGRKRSAVITGLQPPEPV